ncbi:Alpha/Beta hydrolase protein [Emericellopsis atlantica]|uniref:Alpha/Beta hydrolase protein n=1 Tax=Emericellopsis atlantica TaxID=2614577 RepID=A0A9P7ZG91_9HYPO|nr:Alpha/Beta hydrolase protein [Emericellopsis atlantica]KAG9251558.1 Alpha/Beta hydrolase protein [Emericellopsis atlantica]
MGDSIDEPQPERPQDDDREISPSPNSKRLSLQEQAKSAIHFARQSEKLSHEHPASSSSPVALQAKFVTPQDPVIVTTDGGRLPGVPLEEAHKLNILREELQGDEPETVDIKEGDETKERVSNTDDDKPRGQHKVVHVPKGQKGHNLQKSAGATLRKQMPPSSTNPLFPPLPLYGPSSILRDVQCVFFRVASFFLSLAFLLVIVLGALFTSIPPAMKKWFYKLTFRNIDKRRPFYEEEMRRARIRDEKNRQWKKQHGPHNKAQDDSEGTAEEFPPTEGGRDPVICDAGYYARRVGLDVEEFSVQTEDGFIIELWHVYDPKEYTRQSEDSREHLGPTVFERQGKRLKNPQQKPKFPVLLIHGLLQSAGAYCCTDEQSLAFWLCKQGYDVWLGNNRCGFTPRHVLLEYSDPRMWCWNIRQFGVFDLPALISRVLTETGFDKVGLICHSQGTTQTLVALAKEQRPDLGDKITVFCALAPAAYAGPLIGKMYFKFMRIISPAFFRVMFGIHAFIPFMMTMHATLPSGLYGWMGYKVFSFLFNWSDTRWDRGLRDRMFQFSPVYVSAESMRWWLGRECFARHKCILATKDVIREEERVDSDASGDSGATLPPETQKSPGGTAWYNEQVPPFALWVCGNDDLVDGKKLLRRLQSGREPHVKVVHSKVIDEYEHLDVIWAMDAEEQVFREVAETLWKTCHVRDEVRVPKGCEHVESWSPDANEVASSSNDSSE